MADPDYAGTPAPVPAPDVAARDHVRAVTRAAGSSFYLGMRILPEARRDAMFAIYAFCRAVDDIADGAAPAAVKRRELDRWRGRIEALYSGAADAAPGLAPRPATPPGADPLDDPTARALAPAIRAYGLARADFLEVIAGMEMDIDDGMCAPSWERLALYCNRVAGAVGLLSIHVFGDPGAEARRFALALGTALQLTNILRDLKDDARMGRLYLPAERLAAAGIAARTPDAVLADPNLPAACAGLAEIARERYDEAERALAGCNARALRPAIVMMKIYRRVLNRMMAAGWRDLDADPGLPKLEKLWITLRFGVL